MGVKDFRKMPILLTRSKRRSWKFHCQPAHHLADSTLTQCMATHD
jgi:hypothetical protein